jgi:hypothetical protein
MRFFALSTQGAWRIPYRAALADVAVAPNSTVATFEQVVLPVSHTVSR